MNADGKTLMALIREGDRVTIRRPDGSQLTGIARATSNGWEIYTQLASWCVEVKGDTIISVKRSE